MGTPFALYDATQQQDPTAQLENQAALGQASLASSLLNQNQDNSQQPAPQQQIPQQQQPQVQQQQQNPLTGAQPGPVKTGLRGVLLQIMRNVGVAGLPGAAYPGDLLGEAHQRSQAALQESQARTGQYQAQTKELESEANLRNAQAKPILLTDPQTGGPVFGPDGSVQTGTLAQQTEMNDLFKVTGGHLSMPAGLAASIGMPEMAGQPIAVNSFNTLMASQNSKTIESEIARLSQFELAKGRDPNQSPDVQSLIAIRRQMQTFNPSVADEQYRQLYAKQHSGQTLTGPEKDWMAAYEHQKVLAPLARIQLEQNGGGLIPQGGVSSINEVRPNLRPQVQAILDYRQPLPPLGRNNLTNQAIQYYVNALDPTYDATTFPARNAIVKDYTTGATSKNLSAINTALGHLGELNDAVKAASSSDLPLLNKIATSFGIAAGSDAPTVVAAIAKRVAPEITNAYVANGGTGGERGGNESDFDIFHLGTTQVLSNIGESAKLLRSKLAPTEQNWNNTYRPSRPQDQFETRFITPQAQKTLNELSSQSPVGGNTVMMRAPNGQQKPVPANQVDHYKSLGAVVVQ